MRFPGRTSPSPTRAVRLRRRRAVLLAAAVASALTAGCSAVQDDPSDDGEGQGTEQLDGELMVFAAASLTDAFEELGATFTAEHPEVTVTFNFASSSTLATQIGEGAPADVFASANETQMDVLDDAGEVAVRTPLVSNALELAVEAGNPLGIETLEDLERDDVVLVLAASEVPAGELAAQMLQAEGIEVSPSSLEVDVRATLGRVELGEADVAIVYRSDVVTASEAVEGVAIPEARNATTSYPVATLVDAPNPDAAAAWLELVSGQQSARTFEAAGFTPAR